MRSLQLNKRTSEEISLVLHGFKSRRYFSTKELNLVLQLVRGLSLVPLLIARCEVGYDSHRKVAMVYSANKSMALEPLRIEIDSKNNYAYVSIDSSKNTNPFLSFVAGYYELAERIKMDIVTNTKPPLECRGVMTLPKVLYNQ